MICMYTDAALTDRLTDSGGGNPDSDIYNGTYGQSHDRQLFLANEHAVLTGPLDAEEDVITLDAPGFADDEVIIVEAEQMKILSGGGTATLTVQRGYGGTAAVSHPAGTRCFFTFINASNCKAGPRMAVNRFFATQWPVPEGSP